MGNAHFRLTISIALLMGSQRSCFSLEVCAALLLHAAGRTRKLDTWVGKQLRGYFFRVGSIHSIGQNKFVWSSIWRLTGTTCHWHGTTTGATATQQLCTHLRARHSHHLHHIWKGIPGSSFNTSIRL